MFSTGMVGQMEWCVELLNCERLGWVSFSQGVSQDDVLAHAWLTPPGAAGLPAWPPSPGYLAFTARRCSARKAQVPFCHELLR